MRVTNDMIHPQLRAAGRLIRWLLPYYKLSTFRRSRRLSSLSKVFHSRKYLSEQIYIDRPNSKQGDPKLRLCIYRPKAPKENAPGLLWMHGGGFAFGTPEQDSDSYRQFIELTGCTVVAPAYRHSPKAPYPAALEDCYTALLWLKHNALRCGLRPDQLMVGGVSAGGGLAAALAIYARDKGEVAIAFQMPLYPMLDDRMITESSRDNDAPLWNTRSNIAAWTLYLGEIYGSGQVPAYAAPARLRQAHGLPPAFTFVGSIEPFRDETVLYFQMLREAGIEAECIVYEGCFHAFNKIGRYTTPGKQANAALLKHFQYAAEHYFAPQPD
ncbi:MAG: alpha/beta hydrolase [Clostridiales bacterium]|nr:alpha/beta hydrolase [Clostridiales bacterium]